MSYLTLKCTKFNFGWGSALDLTSWGSLQRSFRPPVLKRPYFQGEWTEWKKGRKREGKEQWRRQGRGI